MNIKFLLYCWALFRPASAANVIDFVHASGRPPIWLIINIVRLVRSHQIMHHDGPCGPPALRGTYGIIKGDFRLNEIGVLV